MVVVAAAAAVVVVCANACESRVNFNHKPLRIQLHQPSSTHKFDKEGSTDLMAQQTNKEFLLSFCLVANLLFGLSSHHQCRVAFSSNLGTSSFGLGCFRCSRRCLRSQLLFCDKIGLKLSEHCHSNYDSEQKKEEEKTKDNTRFDKASKPVAAPTPSHYPVFAAVFLSAEFLMKTLHKPNDESVKKAGCP